MVLDETKDLEIIVGEHSFYFCSPVSNHFVNHDNGTQSPVRNVESSKDWSQTISIFYILIGSYLPSGIICSTM